MAPMMTLGGFPAALGQARQCMHVATRFVVPRVQPGKRHRRPRTAEALHIAVVRQQHRNRALAQPRNAVQQIALGFDPAALPAIL